MENISIASQRPVWSSLAIRAFAGLLGLENICTRCGAVDWRRQCEGPCSLGQLTSFARIEDSTSVAAFVECSSAISLRPVSVS